LLGESLIYAARIKDGHLADNVRSETFEYDEVEDADILVTAKRFLKEHPNLLPALSKNGQDVDSWPAETLRHLGGDYRPLKRQRPISYDPFGINVGLGPYYNKR
jgi:hypothetical protein